MKAFLYDMYDGEEKVLESAKLCDVRDYLNSKNFKIADYLNGNLYRGRYTFIVSGTVPDRKDRKVLLPDLFWVEWNRVCQRYQRYEWVKKDGPGVHKLRQVHS